MRVCDICKTEGVRGSYYVTYNEKGHRKDLELCGKCHKELQIRTRYHEYLAYTETVEAMTGQIPRKSHWWDVFMMEVDL